MHFGSCRFAVESSCSVENHLPGETWIPRISRVLEDDKGLLLDALPCYHRLKRLIFNQNAFSEFQKEACHHNGVRLQAQGADVRDSGPDNWLCCGEHPEPWQQIRVDE